LGLAGAFADLCVPTPALVLPKHFLKTKIPLPPLHLDDNFVVPIFSAWACQQLFRLLGWDPTKIQLANALIVQIATATTTSNHHRLGLFPLGNHRSHRGGSGISTTSEPNSISGKSSLPVKVAVPPSHAHHSLPSSSSSSSSIAGSNSVATPIMT
jgi:hypothetical protein